MAEYIEREAAIKCCTFGRTSLGLISELRSIPAADVRPVVRGKWTDGKCDQCGKHAPYWCMATTYYRSNFCPNCGADMRGEQDV